MADRPPYVRRSSASVHARRAAALAGVLVAVAVLAAIAWGVSSVGNSDPPDETTTAAAAAPKKPTLKIVFPEGFTRADMADRVRAVNKIALNKRKIKTRLSPKTYVRLTRKGSVPGDFEDADYPHPEVFLFPATYQFTKDTTTRGLVTMQLDAFANAWGQVDLKLARSKNLTAYDVLVIASMVEKEVQVPKERPLVAAVIYNRLRQGFPLGIDATIRYGLDIPPTEPILQSQLESDSPYNSRRFTGLPPTPIANPGLASIQAAAHPAEVDFLYFVRKPDCRSHFFTASEDEFFNFPRGGLDC